MSQRAKALINEITKSEDNESNNSFDINDDIYHQEPDPVRQQMVHALNNYNPSEDLKVKKEFSSFLEINRGSEPEMLIESTEN
jgi:hypothetical protein